MTSQKDLLTLDYYGLRKIISGGQCGVDRGALEVAKKFRIETGGWAPRGWLTLHGPRPDLADFGLKEHHHADYSFRTEANVIQSDGTIIVGRNTNSPGSLITKKYCDKHKKPVLIIRADDNVLPQSISSFITSRNISILNVAGNRDFDADKNFHYNFIQTLLRSVFLNLEENGKLIMTT